MVLTLVERTEDGFLSRKRYPLRNVTEVVQHSGVSWESFRSFLEVCGHGRQRDFGDSFCVDYVCRTLDSWILGFLTFWTIGTLGDLVLCLRPCLSCLVCLCLSFCQLVDTASWTLFKTPLDSVFILSTLNTFVIDCFESIFSLALARVYLNPRK